MSLPKFLLAWSIVMTIRSLTASTFAALILTACASAVAPQYADTGVRDGATEAAVDVQTTCSPQERLCSGRCVNVLTDPQNCGMCALTCTAVIAG